MPLGLLFAVNCGQIKSILLRGFLKQSATSAAEIRIYLCYWLKIVWKWIKKTNRAVNLYKPMRDH